MYTAPTALGTRQEVKQIMTNVFYSRFFQYFFTLFFSFFWNVFASMLHTSKALFHWPIVAAWSAFNAKVRATSAQESS